MQAIDIRLMLSPIKRFVLLTLTTLVMSCAATDRTSIGPCPQPRFTGRAPESIYTAVNPIGPEREHLAAGRALYEGKAEPGCHACHGIAGDGRGPLASQFDPPPRDFSCASTIVGIPDGQLFWIIKNGSPGTAMPSFEHLRNEQIWQLVLYLRQLAQ